MSSNKLTLNSEELDTKVLADDLYEWMVQAMPNGALLNAAVVCDYAGTQYFKQSLARRLHILIQEQLTK